MTTKARPPDQHGLFAASIGALGVVFGDIGTSPLYTLKTVLDASGGHAPSTILGIMSLLTWTLVVITTVKYAGFAMKFDNHGEGGILALMALLSSTRAKRPVVAALGLFGAALIYGDGAITPAISVLSALEGLELAEPALKPYVLPAAIAILVALFAIQPLGTARIGRAFGSIMAVWFITIAALGVRGIVRHPDVLQALDPMYAFEYLRDSGGRGFLVLGGVFLCVTGAEALYADMGHFGAGPIRFAWSALVFPSLVLNYAGQSAIVLAGAPTDQSPFYQLAPAGLTLPLVFLATLATIIASQSIITGAFSMTRQAIQLGWMPRLRIVQTSTTGYGQIYVGAVNWTLMIVTVGLAVAFRRSDSLAAAYGIAVSATMVLTTTLLFVAMREIWKWSLAASAVAAGGFFLVDTAFFVSNSLKFLNGGYVPLLIALGVYTVMLIWHRGVAAVSARLAERPQSIGSFMAGLERDRVARVPGSAVFLTRVTGQLPPIIEWYVRHSHALHRSVFAVHLETVPVPWVAAGERFRMEECAPGFWFVYGKYGFAEKPDLPRLMHAVAARCGDTDASDFTYFVGLEKVALRDDSTGMPRWMAAAFSAMLRNCGRVSDYLNIPSAQLVDLGRQVAI